MPVTIVSPETPGNALQDVVFRNPRGQYRYYYALLTEDVSGVDTLKLFNSSDGITWNEQTVKSGAKNGSMVYVEDAANSQLIVYIVYTDDTNGLTFVRGTIADDSTTATFGTARQLFADGVARDMGVIEIDKDDYCWICYSKQISGAGDDLFVDGFVDDRGGWTRVGASPWLGAIDYPTNYIYSVTDEDTIGDFTFANLAGGGIITSVEVKLYLRHLVADNEKVQVYLYDSVGGWEKVGDITPTTTWAWYSIDVTSKLNTTTKVNLAKMYLVYQRVGGPSLVTIEVDAAKLTVIRKKGALTCIATTDIIEDFVDPSDPSWSSEEQIYVSREGYDIYGTMKPPSATRDMVFLMKYVDANIEVHLRAEEYDWDGTIFSNPNAYDVNLTDNTPNSGIGIRFDVSNNGHVIYQNFLEDPLNRLRYRSYTLGTGFGSPSNIDSEGIGMSMTIDLTQSPNILIVFYRKSVGTNRVRYATSAVTSISWTLSSIVDNSEILQWFRTSRRDYNSYVLTVYNTYTTSTARFLEIETPVPAVVVGYYYQDGLVCVNVG